MREQYRHRHDMLKKIMCFLTGKRHTLMFLLLLELLLLMIEMLKPLLYQSFIDDIIGNKAKKLLPYVLGGYVVLLLFEMIFQWFRVNCHNRVLFQLLKNIKLVIWNKYEHQDSENSNLLPSDQKLILENDVEKVGTLVYEQSIQYIVSILLILYTSIMMLYINPGMAILSFFSIPITLYIDYKIGKKEKVMNEDNRQNDTNMNAWLHKSMDNWRDYRLLGLQQRQKREYDEFQNKFAAYNIRWINYWVARVLIIPELKNEFLMKLMVYLVGGYLISQGKLTIGQLLLFIMYYSYFSNAVQSIANKNAVLLEDAPQMDRVFEQLNEEKVKKESKPLNLITSIEMQEVSFRYESKEVLDRWNLELSQGDMVALDGESGRGKTTCLKLLLNLLQPESGFIRINGIDINEFQREHYYHRISCVMQESMIFDSTIRENLLYAKPEATEEELISCCQITGIYEKIKSWQQGFDTVIGEKGMKLSGGERQRLCLARALLKEADVLILDEATSALDTRCEYEIWKQIRTIMKNKIVIIITHRDTVKNLCNRVVTVGK